MAKLTPLGKSILALTIASAVGAVVWHLALRDAVFGQPATDGSPPSGTADSGGSVQVPAPPPNSPSQSVGAVGTKNNPLKVSLVEFTGYAPALVANGGALATKPGSIYDQAGLSVEFLIQNDVPQLATGFGSNTFQCAWRTVDFWSQEQPGLRAGGFDGRMVMVVDNSRGADMLIAWPGIDKVEDLLGKKVALLQFTPSHWMIDYAIDNSSLLAPQKKAVRNDLVFVSAEEGTPGVRAMFESKSVHAAVLWDPDASLALRQPGAHVVFDTTTASNLVYDGIVCDKRLVDAQPDVVQKLVTGWMQGVEAAKKDKKAAVAALTATEPTFKELAQKEGDAFIEKLFAGILWTGLEDNVRILGRATQDGGDFGRVYSEAGLVWRNNGGMADTSAPPIPPPAAFDFRFIDSLVAAQPQVNEAAKRPEFQFSEQERQKVVTKAVEPVLTKPASVYFNVSSSELDRNAKRILDDQVAPLVQNMGNSYISLEGNTDKTGSADKNRALSRARAQAVVDYLVANFGFDKDRFRVLGNGPDKPLCTDATAECLEQNRRTDVAVYAR